MLNAGIVILDRAHTTCVFDLALLFNIQVIWKRLYKTSSGMERGTLYQLRNAINCRNVTKSCKNDMNT